MHWRHAKLNEGVSAKHRISDLRAKHHSFESRLDWAQTLGVNLNDVRGIQQDYAQVSGMRLQAWQSQSHGVLLQLGYLTWTLHSLLRMLRGVTSVADPPPVLLQL